MKNPHIYIFYINKIIYIVLQLAFSPSYCLNYFIDWLATPRSLWDPSSPTRDWTQVHGSESPSLNHWTAREFPALIILNYCVIFHCMDVS